MTQIFIRGVNNLGKNNQPKKIRDIVSGLLFPVLTGDLLKKHESGHGDINHQKKYCILAHHFYEVLMSQENGIELTSYYPDIKGNLLLIFDKNSTYEEVIL